MTAQTISNMEDATALDDCATLPEASYFFPRIFGGVKSQPPLVLKSASICEPDALSSAMNVEVACQSQPDPFHSDWTNW